MLLLHQRCLETAAGTVHAAAQAAEAALAAAAAALPASLAALAALEQAVAALWHGHVAAGHAHAARAAAASGVALTMEGALGVRTKFQTDATAQLFVRAEPAAGAPPAGPAQAALPVVAAMDDDTVLAEGVRFLEAHAPSVLTPEQQSYVLAAAMHVQKARAADECVALRRQPAPRAGGCAL